MRSVQFTIPGRLTGWKRSRINTESGTPQFYNHAKMRSHQGIVRHYAGEAIKGHSVLEGPLSLEVQMTLHTPKSWSKKKKAFTRYVTGKPDVDNLIKLICDAANNILYRDDSEFAEVRIIRRYDDSTPEAVYVSVCELFDGPPIREARAA